MVCLFPFSFFQFLTPFPFLLFDGLKDLPIAHQLMSFFCFARSILFESPTLLISFILGILTDKISSKVWDLSLVIRLQFYTILNNCFGRMGLTPSAGAKLIFREYPLMLTLTTIMIFSFIILYVKNCLAFKIFSLTYLISIGSYVLIYLVPKDLKLHFLFLFMLYLLCLLVTFSPKESKKTSKFMRMFFTHLPHLRPKFFFISVTPILFPFIELCTLRFLDYHPFTISDWILYFYIILTGILRAKTRSRSKYFRYFLADSFPNFRPFPSYEIITLFLGTALSSQVEPFNWLLTLINYPLSVCFGYDPILSILHLNPFKLFYMAAFNVPYFLASYKTRELQWERKFEAYYPSYSPIFELFPAILSIFLSVFCFSHFYFVFFKPEQIFLQVLAHSIFIIEIVSSVPTVLLMGDTLQRIYDEECDKNEKERIGGTHREGWHSTNKII